MTTDSITQMLTATVEELSKAQSLEGLFHQHRDGDPLPSSRALEEIIELSRSILFPGYFGKSTVSLSTLPYHIGVNVERLHKLLTDQIMAGLCFCECAADEEDSDRSSCRQNAEQIAAKMLTKYPDIRRTLATDVEAAYNGDPAAESFGEIISCYPVIKTLVNYRIAHELLLLGVPLIPRIITEMAHSETGIDIHPGAQIGEYFAIDHGTGVVIGETSIIGNHVTLYQGVTLGSKSFKKDSDGNMLNIPRHPIIEDNVTIYSNASILGRITIGHDSVIGGNIWVTHNVAPNSRVLQSKAVETHFEGGLGI